MVIFHCYVSSPEGNEDYWIILDHHGQFLWDEWDMDMVDEWDINVNIVLDEL